MDPRLAESIPLPQTFTFSEAELKITEFIKEMGLMEDRIVDFTSYPEISDVIKRKKIHKSKLMSMLRAFFIPIVDNGKRENEDID